MSKQVVEELLSDSIQLKLYTEQIEKTYQQRLDALKNQNELLKRHLTDCKDKKKIAQKMIRDLFIDTLKKFNLDTSEEEIIKVKKEWKQTRDHIFLYHERQLILVESIRVNVQQQVQLKKTLVDIPSLQKLSKEGLSAALEAASVKNNKKQKPRSGQLS